ncbi:hypothetical protein KR074_007529 [Drosophila pseudoananassae]|nr:hypothetical protein KR074_007529 [Drosophila pseudoananassae]
MSKNILKSHMLKEMERSFHLTEARELASGRKKPGKFGGPIPANYKPRPAGPMPKKTKFLQEIEPKDGVEQQNQPPRKKKKKQKSKGAPASISAEINKPTVKAQSAQTLSKGPTKQEKKSQTSPKNKTIKRPLDSSKDESGGPKKKQKKVAVTTKGKAPLKNKKSEARINGKGPVPIPKSSINGRKGASTPANPGMVVPIALASIELSESEDDDQNEEVLNGNCDLKELIQDDSGDGVSDLFKDPQIFKASKRDKGVVINLAAPFKDYEVVNANQLQPKSSGIVKKISVFEEALLSDGGTIESDDEDGSSEESEVSFFQEDSHADGCTEESDDEDGSDGWEERKVSLFEGNSLCEESEDEDWSPSENGSSDDMETDSEDSGSDGWEERKVSLFEGNSLCEESEDEDWSPSENESSDDMETDSEDSESEESYNEESFDSETFDFSLYNSDLDSTFEPEEDSLNEDSGSYDDSCSENSIDSLPPHLKPEPLIIEEIFDDEVTGNIENKNSNNKGHPEDSLQLALVLKKPDGPAEIRTQQLEHPVAVPPENIREEAEDMEQPENDQAEPEAVDNTQYTSAPTDNNAPFYRNPEARLSELSVFENSLKSNHVLAVIKEDLEFYGTVILTLLGGQITVNGYRPRCQESLTIYSPKGINWVCVSPKKSKRPGKDKIDWDKLNLNFTRAQLERIQANFESQTDAIVLLQRNTSSQRLVDGFEKHMSQNVFPQVNTSNRPLHRTESLLHCLVQSSDGQRTMQVPQVWNKLRLLANSRMMFVGGKGVGKSSLLRYLVNRSLGQFPKILLIDLDIGQPELFVAQTVSCTLIEEPLLGPGFFLNKQPDRAYAVGHVNVVMCAEEYANAVTQLARHIQKDAKYQNLPWLINTMGYNKGFGTELVALLADRFRPTDVVQIESKMAINNFDSPLEWSTLAQSTPIVYTSDEFVVKEIPKYTLHKLASAVPLKERGAWSMSAKDLRYSNLLARLSSCLTGNAKTLTDLQPVVVSLELLKIQHLTSEEYTREELIQGMEANVVYLCRQDEGPPECLGIGVVRAIDYENGKLYLVPAMPLIRLTFVNCLVLGGELTLPQGYFKNQGSDVSSSVPFVFNLEDSKSSKSIQQIYHRTPAFLGAPGARKQCN